VACTALTSHLDPLSKSAKQHYDTGDNSAAITSTSISKLGIMSKLAKGASSLKDLDATFKLEDSFLADSEVKQEIASWRSSVESDIKKIPRFSTLMKTGQENPCSS